MAGGLIATIPKNRREHVRVTLTAFNGRYLADVRVYVQAGGEAKPTRLGVSLSLETLPALRAALKKAEAEARRLGLLG